MTVLVVYLSLIILMSMAMQLLILGLHRFDARPVPLHADAPLDLQPGHTKGAGGLPQDGGAAFVTGRLATQKAAERNWVVRNGMRGKE